MQGQKYWVSLIGYYTAKPSCGWQAIKSVVDKLITTPYNMLDKQN
jgi:hypothetical protein